MFVFASAPFAFHVLSGHEPDLLGFCDWFGFVFGAFLLVVGVFVGPGSFSFWSGSFPRTPHVNSG